MLRPLLKNIKLVELVGIAPTSSETQTSGSPCSGCTLRLIPGDSYNQDSRKRAFKLSFLMRKARRKNQPCGHVSKAPKAKSPRNVAEPN